MLTITTSWDDGDVLDERLASVLNSYHIKGTFYIAKEYRQRRLSDDAIRTLALRHEIGAHTLTHPNLAKISKEEKERQIRGSKEWLEKVTGREVPMFCYPAGHYDQEAKEIVRSVGYRGARTTKFGVLTPAFDPFEIATTLSVYPVPFRKTGPRKMYWGKLLQPMFERVPTLRRMGVPLLAFRSFETLACAAFDVAEERSGVFHLWGHSWEIEKYDLWKPLERVLRYISDRKGCCYKTNGELL